MFYAVIYLLHNVHQNVYIRGSLRNNTTDFLSQISSAQLGTKTTGNEIARGAYMVLCLP